MPREIVQVNSNMGEAFLGRISALEGHLEIPDNLKIFNDPTFRIILVTEAISIRLLHIKW